MFQGRGIPRPTAVYDHMMLDGLEDAYRPGRAMGTFGESAPNTTSRREAQDAFAIPA